jgi:hypothetical protein
LVVVGLWMVVDKVAHQGATQKPMGVLLSNGTRQAMFIYLRW